MDKLPLLHERILTLDSNWMERTAVKASKGELRYAQLQKTAFQIANYLHSKGCRPGDRIGVCLPKSLESVQILLGALCAGVIYVPIDYKAPIARIETIVADAEAAIAFVESGMHAALAEKGCTSLELVNVENIGSGNGLDNVLLGISDNKPQCEGNLEDVAAILYTSGSTGIPKGVMLSHQNISSFVQWAVRTFEITSNDRLISHAPFHFDLSTLDLYATFSVGASVYLLDDTLVKFPSSISKILEKEKITSWYSVPTALRLLVEHGALDRRDLSSLRQVFFAGEVFPVPGLRKVMSSLPGVEFVNLYGPTETNVCTYHRLPGIPDKSKLSISIGKGCENVEIIIVDPEENPVVDGEQGEICVKGPTVMKGYWRRDDLTQASRLCGDDNTYKTGDYGSWDSDGTIKFLGRRDAQIKIRGHRVELSEIESVIVAQEQIREAVVTLVRSPESEDQLVAFVVPEVSTVSESIVFEQCSNYLPSYAQPHRVIIRKDFPRTSTGKINRVHLKTEAQALQ
jgi:amino acid adenylation domain-containing protein